MSHRPVLEDVDDDIDNMDMDIAQFDPNLRTPIAPVQVPHITRSQDIVTPSLESTIPPPSNDEILDPNKFTDDDRQQIGSFQVIYPCYFDKNRSHSQGRRVASSKAVENPLAYTISRACRYLRVPVVLELDKTHPQDFGNPGRVRVLLKEEKAAVDSRFKSKRALLNTIADYLATHKTTLETISPSGGIPCPPEYKSGFTPGEIPKVKGFAMNTIVPIHSNLTIKHPMTKAIYDQKAPEAPQEQKTVKQPKKKVMKIRG